MVADIARRPAVQRWSARLWVVVLGVAVPATADAQNGGARFRQPQSQPAQTQPAQAQPVQSNSVNVLNEAHRLSSSAKTEEDYARIIQLCEEGLAKTSQEQYIKYAHQLLSWAYNRRGELLADNQREKEALADFEKAVENDPTRWQAVHNRAVSYAKLGLYEEALSDFDRTIELNPKYGNAYFNRGELRYAQNNFDGAISDYTEAIKISPEDASAYNSRGHAYYRKGNYRSAVTDYNQAIRLDPQNGPAYTNRGDAFADLGQYAQAANDYRAAVRLDPNLGRAYQSAAWLMATCPNEEYRNPELAIEAAKKAIELDGEGDHRYLDTMAAAYANSGQFEEAQKYEKRAIEIAPPELAARYERRLALYEQDQPYRDVLNSDGTQTGGGAPPDSTTGSRRRPTGS